MAMTEPAAATSGPVALCGALGRGGWLLAQPASAASTASISTALRARPVAAGCPSPNSADLSSVLPRAHVHALVVQSLLLIESFRLCELSE